MGIKGLESYLHYNCPNACRTISIPELVHEYKTRTGLTPVLLVDAYSLLHNINPSTWLNGGQIKEWEHFMKDFFNKFANMGVEVVFCFDGPPKESKMSVWRKRRIDSIVTLSTIFSMLPSDVKHIERNFNPFLPINGTIMINDLINEYQNVKFYRAIHDGDLEMAVYAKKNRCFGILAQDTDFIIFQSADYYLSAKHLNLADMTTVHYDSAALAHHLGIAAHQLPSLAVVAGNDFISNESLWRFWNSLDLGPRNRRDKFLILAEFIKELPANYTLLDFSRFVFDNDEMEPIIRDVLDMYTTTCLPPDNIPNCEDENWKAICLEVTRRHRIESIGPLYNVIVLAFVSRSTLLEDYYSDRPRSGNVTKELRRYLYGILLFEKPGNKQVKELITTGVESLKEPALVEPIFLRNFNHPGLLTLWNDKSESMYEIKLKILAEIFCTDLEKIKNLQKGFLIPSLSLRYLKDKLDVEEWEVDSFLCSVVCLRDYNVEHLQKLPDGPLCSRSIWYFTVIMVTCTTIYDILRAFGNPFSPNEVSPVNYQDGKLFHKKYRMMRGKADLITLCENQKNYEDFLQLKKFCLS